MGAVSLQPETVFLREFVDTYKSEVGFKPTAEEQMREEGVNLLQVLQVFRNGVVTSAEKDEADGAIWTIEGNTCDGEKLIVDVRAHCDRYHVCILGVQKG